MYKAHTAKSSNVEKTHKRLAGLWLSLAEKISNLKQETVEVFISEGSGFGSALTVETDITLSSQSKYLLNNRRVEIVRPILLRLIITTISSTTYPWLQTWCDGQDLKETTMALKRPCFYQNTRFDST